MKVPFRVVWKAEKEAASSLFFEGNALAPALDLCARLGLDPASRMFAVEGGVILRLAEPMRGAWIGALSLRALASHLLIPTNADLVPSLLDDEAEGLTRTRGLVFLPGGRVLAFSAKEPLRLDQMLSVSLAPKRDWRSPPEPPYLADHVAEFLLVSSQTVAGSPDQNETIDPSKKPWENGNDDIGSEATANPARDAAPGAAGQATVGLELGKALIRLGSALRIKGLARLGATMVQRALDTAPALGERVFGKQSAALRDVLRQFKNGEIEKALKHAPPLGEPKGESRGARRNGGGRLPENDLHYRLASLLKGDAARGPGGFWMAEADVLAALSAEYRLAAQSAVERGDFRRAATIFAKLLRDDRSAANVLNLGGFYRDAALLYLVRLNDKKAAAQAFAQAGEIDRAISLYRQADEQEAAGDLLRSVGEHEAAFIEYQTAANRLAKLNPRSGGRLAAGRLLSKKAGRRDLAEVWFREGWNDPQEASPIVYGLELLNLLGDQGRADEIRALAHEVERRFQQVSTVTLLAKFYHQLVDVSDRPGLESIRDDMHDWARIALAGQLHESIQEGRRPPQAIVSQILGGQGTWTPSAISDAEFALNAALTRFAKRPPEPPPPRHRTVQGAGWDLGSPGAGSVACLAWANVAGRLFMACESGEIFAIQPARRERVPVCGEGGPILQMVVSTDADRLLVLRQEATGGVSLTSFLPHGDRLRRLGHSRFETDEPTWITPMGDVGHPDAFGFWMDPFFKIINTRSLHVEKEFSLRDEPPEQGELTTALVLSGPALGDRPMVLSLRESRWFLSAYPYTSHELVGTFPYADPIAPPGSPSWGWRRDGGTEVALLDPSGTVTLSGFTFPQRDEKFPPNQPLLAQTFTHSSGRRGGYGAVAIVLPGFVVASAASRLDWFKAPEVDTAPLSFYGSSEFANGTVAGLFAHRSGGQLVVVSGNGRVRTLPDQPLERA